MSRMRSLALMGCLAALVLAGPGRADEPKVLGEASVNLPHSGSVPLPISESAEPVDSNLDLFEGGTPDRYLPRFWAEADYLLTWTKTPPVPPLVTTGPVNLGGGAVPGTLGRPGTAVLIGDQDQTISPNSGLRLILGAWLGSGMNYGFEATYLWVMEQNTRSDVRSPGTPGSRALSIPFIDVRTQSRTAIPIALPTGPAPFSGGASLDLATEFQGWDATGICCLYECSRYRLDALVGYRYFAVDERLTFSTASSNIFPATPDVFRTTDSFVTRNDFHGGHVGLRFQRYLGRLYLRGQTKIALGNVHQEASVQGVFVTDDFTRTPQPRRFPGGYLTQPTNLGDFATDRLAVVPEVTVGVGYHVLDWMRVSVSYTFIYLSSVMRPGDQISPFINPTQGPAFTGNPNSTLVGPPAPLFPGQVTDFWVQGLNLGVEMRF